MIIENVKRLFAVMFCVAFTMVANASNAHAANLVQTAVNAGNFTRLIKALEFTGLDATLTGGEFTVLAPTDEAFAAFDEANPGLLENLMTEGDAGKNKIKDILLYHVVKGKVNSKAVAGMSSGTAVNGKSFTVSAHNGGVKINDATVIKADIMASNGIIHVIDKVLTPPAA